MRRGDLAAERATVRRRQSPATAAFVLAVAAIAASDQHTAIAQFAPPTSRPSGVLGPQDHRVQIAADQWPWSAIGRVNIAGISARESCTGTLVAPRRVLTAAHCMFNTRTNDWFKPREMHFVAGQTRNKFLGHSLVDSFVTSPQFRFHLEDRQRYDYIASNMIKHDWAILTLHDALPIKPIPVRAVADSELPFTRTGGTIALAGYAADHPYMLSVHRGCEAAIDAPTPGIIAHRCDAAPGESGGPILLLRDGSAELIGIHSSNEQRFIPGGGYQAIGARGVAAAQFEAAVNASP
jgi:protease YdgD